MSNLSDSTVVVSQYKDASKLNTRIDLHTLYSTNKYGWFRWLFDRFDLPSTCHILDVGAGSGDLWLENHDRLADGWTITVTDVFPGMLNKAQKNLAGGDRPFSFAVVDAQAIPFGDERFDVVIANHMLYHVPNLEKALSELRRVLKSGGRFYASTVGWTHMQGLRDLVCEYDPDVAPWNAQEAVSFALENGRDLLAPWFSGVERQRYPDNLVVIEAEPLVAYMQSMVTLQSPRIERDPAAFTRYVKAKIASQGAIRISKDSGVFLAVR